MNGLQIFDKVKDNDLVIRKGLLIINMRNDIKESKKIGEKGVLRVDCYVAGLNRMEDTRERQNANIHRKVQRDE